MCRCWLLPALFALLAAGALAFAGYGWPTAIALGAIVSVVTRWLLLWRARTSEHLRHGGSTGLCPRCQHPASRQRGAAIPECGRCGWRAGPPFVRWLTHSVPATQLGRTVLGPGLLVVLVLSAALVLGVTDQSENPFGVEELTGPAETLLTGDDADSSGDNRVAPPTDGERVADGYDARSDETTNREGDLELSAAAALVVTETNEARAEAGLGKLTEDRALTLVAAAHTGDMIEREYFSHTSPDGDGPLERVQAGNPDPACRAVGENLGQVIWDAEFRANYGSEHVETEAELAESLVAQWLYSESHRETLLDEEYDRVGVALGIDGDRVYATQKLCR